MLAMNILYAPTKYLHKYARVARLSKRPGSVWNCLWGRALKISPGINRKSRVSYLGPGFLSSATWPSLAKMHYNGLNQTKHFFNKVCSTYPSLRTVMLNIFQPV